MITKYRDRAVKKTNAINYVGSAAYESMFSKLAEILRLNIVKIDEIRKVLDQKWLGTFLMDPKGFQEDLSKRLEELSERKIDEELKSISSYSQTKYSWFSL